MFGVTQDEAVTIERENAPDRCHLYAHADHEQLIQAVYAGDKIEINDPTGLHVYPGDKVVGLHFGHIPNYTRATMQLWQDNNGYGQLGRFGSADLFIVDPADPENAWKIRTWIIGRYTFAVLAANLIEGTIPDATAFERRVPLADLVDMEHVATWQHAGRVEIIESPDREGMPVARTIAQTFIGIDGMGAADRN